MKYAVIVWTSHSTTRVVLDTREQLMGYISELNFDLVQKFQVTIE